MANSPYLMNSPSTFVPDGLAGLEFAYSNILTWNRDPSFVARAEITDKVALVSGGGSGHEPLHSGFVGVGMLDAAVPGDFFASPAAYQVAEAMRHVQRGRGVLQIIKNYTGDLINFRVAAEQLRAEGVPVESVVVDDDIAGTAGGARRDTGRRGTAAVIAVQKICGAAAEQGASLEELGELGRRVVAEARSLAASWGPVVHPVTGQPSFDLARGEMEFGVGIHGERGEKRTEFGTTEQVVKELAEPLVAELGLNRGDEVLAIVNGLGGTQQLELLSALHSLSLVLNDAGVTIARSLTGSYVTSLNMAGLSLTLLRLDEKLKALWDAPVSAPALRW